MCGEPNLLVDYKMTFHTSEYSWFDFANRCGGLAGGHNLRARFRDGFPGGVVQDKITAGKFTANAHDGTGFIVLPGIATGTIRASQNHIGCDDQKSSARNHIG